MPRSAAVNRLNSRRYRKAHPELVRAYNTEYRKENHEKVANLIKGWVENNRERKREINRRYKRKHKALVLSLCAQRRAAELRATPPWVNAKELLEVYEHREHIEAATGDHYHVDHIVPLKGKTVCGLHVPWNLAVIPAIENMKKHNTFAGGTNG